MEFQQIRKAADESVLGYGTQVETKKMNTYPGCKALRSTHVRVLDTCWIEVMTFDMMTIRPQTL
jgi:hypothetical protein